MGLLDGHDLAVKQDLGMFGFHGKVLMVVCRDGVRETLGNATQAAIGKRVSQPG
jgi:hypothetical protein